ncbi:hypothetical protein NBH15_02215 [Parabacteroides sp. W1-Q-101]|uniref:hypothetical protein n=1 Tax=Parabacteroides TaxID=375288 RepID=UPI0020302AA1|nr:MULTISPECIES: hypothetical protein [Parabacteroides]MCM0717086.1 hypothetical protein [Parabacteroides sp. W1-Q-101]
MDLFNFFTKREKIKLSDLFNISKKWTDIYLKQNPKVSNFKSYYAEILMFNSWAAYFYCHNENKIQDNDPNEFIESLYFLVGACVDMERSYFDVLINVRLRLYKGEIESLLQSDYPRTKQYIPFHLYCALEINPLKPNPTIEVDDDDISFDDAMAEWIGKVYKHWNFIMRDIRDITNSINE